MPLVAVDIRANHDTGVARYGRSVLAAVAPLAREDGIKILTVVRPGHGHTAAAALDHGHEVIEIGSDTGFVRDNPELRDLLTARGVDLYYTSHYTVDRQCPVPFTFTIHDLTRMRMPHLSYTDRTFAERFGTEEADRVRAELSDLADLDTISDSEETFTRYFTALNRDLAARAHRITTVSRSTAADITSLLHYRDDRLDLVPCGVDVESFRPRPRTEVTSVRAKFGLTYGPYLAFVGLTHPNKRFDWLADQLTAARQQLPAGARLAAIGGHADQVPAVRDMLRDRGAEDFVVFTGRVSDDELAALYSGAAAWVTASLNEGNNLPPLEALACGSEVIATDIPPLRESLGEHAHFYSPTDPAALVDRAAAVLAGTADRRQPGFRVPSWHDAGQALLASWRAALHGDRPAAGSPGN
ncbi:glycosyltransferase family 4 protein [Kitasatospora sp. HPMI-4]|uniref:glycosyltransferase family 4 protein n=1 Tax=Kitasatospora sp. HPMI-4 TaxID=3448443 RepID=UPI003F1E085B